MKKADRNGLLILPVVILAALGIALADNQGSASVPGVPVFALTVAVVFMIQWVGFIAAYRLQTERFYDLTGSCTYISVTMMAVLLSPTMAGRSVLLLILVVLRDGRNHDGKTMPSGLYFYRLETEGRRDVKKLILTR